LFTSEQVSILKMKLFVMPLAYFFHSFPKSLSPSYNSFRILKPVILTGKLETKTLRLLNASATLFYALICVLRRNEKLIWTHSI